MKHFAAIFAIFSGIIVGWIACGVVTPAPAPPRTGAAEVTDLIERLKPLVKEPNSRWSGTRITFTGAGVAVEMNLANGDKYSGEARTLGGAVSRITAPSADIKAALDGWSAQ